MKRGVFEVGSIVRVQGFISINKFQKQKNAVQIRVESIRMVYNNSNNDNNNSNNNNNNNN